MNTVVLGGGSGIRLSTVAVWLRILIPLALVGVPAVTLVQLVPDRIDTPLAPDTRGWPAVPAPLVLTRAADGVLDGRLVLEDPSPARTLSHPEIRLLMATRGAHPRLARGSLRVVGTSCAYSTQPDAVLADNQLLSFARCVGCDAANTAPPARYQLDVSFTGAPEIDLWTYVAPGDASGEMLALATPVPIAGSGRSVVRGRLVRPGPGAAQRRVTLLNYVWQVSRSSAWIWTGLAVAAALMIAGALAFPWSAIADPAAPGIILRGSVGAACLAAALGLQYAILVPPLQAPDEPNHLLGYAAVVHNERLVAETADLAKRGHLQRIKFHSDESFRPSDLGKPFPVPWDGDVTSAVTNLRSPATTAVWKAVGAFLVDAPVARVLLTIRLVNVGLFSLAVGLAGCLLVGLGAGSYRQTAMLPFLLVPALPFFAMHVSDFSVLTAAYVLLSASLSVLVLDGRRAHFAGLPLALSAVLAVACGRNSWPLVVLVSAVLAGRVLLGSRDDREGPLRPWKAVIFWGGIAAGASGITILLPALRANVEQNLPAARFGPVLEAFGLLGRWPWWPVAVLLVCPALEVAVLALRRRFRWGWPSHTLTALGATTAALILAIPVASLVVDYPSLPVVEVPTPPTAGQYVRQVLTVMGTSLRFGPPDHLLVRSFWTGFGWIDTLPNPMVTQFLVLASGAAALGLLTYLSITRDARRLAITLLFLGGGVATLATYALSAYWRHVNLHGRYLVGLYLCALGAGWSVVSLLPSWPRWPRVPRSAVLLTTCVSLHSYCLRFILCRYF